MSNMREREVVVVCGIGEKKSNGGTQWYLQDRVFDANGLCPALTTLGRGYWIIIGLDDEEG